MMKKIFCTLVSLTSIVVLCQGQVDRSQAPKAGPAPQINIGSPAGFTTSNGIRVFVVENHEVPHVTVSLVLKKEPILEKDKVGFVDMEGQLMRRGTTTRSKAQLDEDIDFLGGSVGTSSGGASASGLTRNFDKIFRIFSDVILHPSFPDSELVKVKKQTLSGLEADKDDPDAISSNVVSVINYGKDHPYGEVETDSTVSHIRLEDLKHYYHTFWKPNIAYMAFVGDITTAHARELVQRYLGEWEKGPVPDAHYPIPEKPAKTMITVVDRPAAVQTNINVTDPVVLKPGDSDNFPVSVMNEILGGGSSGRLFQDLREKHGFTYGAYSSISDNPLVGSFIADAAVRTPVTDSAIARFLFQLNRIRDEKVSLAVLDSAKNQISGNFALALESPSLIAQFALNIARYHMPADYYKNYLKSIAAVTPEEIARVARKYITPRRANIILVGDSKGFADKLGQFGDVRYVDIYGNPVQAPAVKSIPDGLTAQQVVQRYIDAIGGADKLNGVKDLTLHLSASMMGQQIAVTQQFMLPAYFEMSMTLPSQNLVAMKILVSGDSVSMSSMGGEVPMTDARRAELKGQTDPFPEMNFLKGTYQLTLAGIKPVNGGDAYLVKATDSGGKTSSYYFDTKTGLEVRKIIPEDGPTGKVDRITDMSDYKEVDGIKLPYSIVSQNGPQKVKMTVQEVKVNSGLTPSDFR